MGSSSASSALLLALSMTLCLSPTFLGGSAGAEGVLPAHQRNTAEDPAALLGSRRELAHGASVSEATRMAHLEAAHDKQRELRARKKSSPHCPSYPNSPLQTQGGPLITGGLNVYLIFYGNWESSPCATNVVSNLLYSLMLSYGSTNLQKLWGAVTQYCDTTTGKFVNTTVNIQSFVTYRGSKKSLEGLVKGVPSTSPNSVWQVFVANQQSGSLQQANIAQGGTDPNGFYLILPSADVTVTGDKPCGWHSSLTYTNPYTKKSYNVPFGVVPQPKTSGPTAACQVGRSFQNCPTIDKIAGKIVSLLAGAATNPFGTGYQLVTGGGQDISTACDSGGFAKIGGIQGSFDVKKVVDLRTGTCSLG